MTRGSGRIWLYAFGYFAAYAPYGALTKLVSSGKVPGATRALGGLEMLPLTTVVSMVGMFVFLGVSGFYRYASRRSIGGVSVPWPGRWTLLSGLATAAIIASTTLAYTFEGVSIVFMMLLMRGGVLVVAPIVDLASSRKVAGASWVALGLSLSALVVTVRGASSFRLTPLATGDVAVYLAAYFVRLRLMTKLAKSDSKEVSLRYFVEEQMVATPAIVAFLAAVALAGQGPVAGALRAGFVDPWSSGAGGALVLVGLLSQATGVFGALVLLDGRENAFSVPVNRASSVLAGLVASAALAAAGSGAGLPLSELLGAALLVAAIVVLAWPRPRRRRPH